MRRDRQFNPTGHLLLGIMIVVLGVLFTLDNLNVLHAREFIRYWPAALIVLGLVKMGQAKAAGGRIGGAIWILIGTVLLSQRLGFVDVNIWSLWPLVLVIIGARMVAQAFYGESAAASEVDTGAVTSAVAVLGHVDRRITGNAFQHGEITAFMGGGKFDLREASLAGGQATINVLVMMGGFEIYVPPTWNVVIEATPILGGIDDRRRTAPSTVDAPRLILRGFAVMGGIEIKD